MEDPPKKFFRLAPGREVRLRYAYFVTCREVVKDAAGEVVELRCTYDPATRGGDAPDGRKVQGDAALGVGGARRAGRGAALRSRCSRGPIPDAGRRLPRRPQSALARGAARRQARAGAGRRADRRARCSSSGSATSAPIPDSAPGTPGLQPHRRAARHLGEGAGKERMTACNSAPRCSSPTPR